MKKLFPISFILLVFSFNGSAQEWNLIYENNPEGERVTGVLEELKNSIKAGKEIRIAWGFQHPTQENVSVYHLADAAFLTIQSDSIVYAQIRPIYGQIPDFESSNIILKENLEWTFIGGTHGKMDAMTRNTITGEIVDHQLRKSWFKWYVRP